MSTTIPWKRTSAPGGSCSCRRALREGRAVALPDFCSCCWSTGASERAVPEWSVSTPCAHSWSNCSATSVSGEESTET
eukprot:scaffold69688_cov32-Tisochrysis_lutea.AAC.6